MSVLSDQRQLLQIRRAARRAMFLPHLPIPYISSDECEHVLIDNMEYCCYTSCSSEVMHIESGSFHVVEEPVVYEYRMVQVPPTLVVSGKQTGQEAAAYLQAVVNQQAAEGWEFYRVDTIGVQEKPGCLAAFGGRPPVTVHHYVVTFRRPRQ